MSDPQIDQLKDEERIKIDIPVEEEAARTAKSGAVDLGEEFKRLGRQFADTLESAFNSQEARRIEAELRTGMRTFADEVERVFHEAKDSPTAARLKDEATAAKDRVETGDMARKVQEGMASGLRWISVELDRLANQFTPTEPTQKEPPAE